VLFVVATSKQNCSGFSALVKQSKTDGGQRDEACKDPKREEEGKEGLAGGTRMEEGVRGMDYKKKQVVGNVTATNGTENFVIIGLKQTRFAILTLAPHFIDTD
jgi:hypothetical protein